MAFCDKSLTDAQGEIGLHGKQARFKWDQHQGKWR
jgi:hypothetical protein